MPKQKFTTVRQSDDKICDAREDSVGRLKTPLTKDQIRVHLKTGPVDFSEEDDDLDDLAIEDSSEEEEVDVGVVEIKEIELPPALLENKKVDSYLSNLLQLMVPGISNTCTVAAGKVIDRLGECLVYFYVNVIVV